MLNAPLYLRSSVALLVRFGQAVSFTPVKWAAIREDADSIDVLREDRTAPRAEQMGMTKLLLKIKLLMFEVKTRIRSNSDGNCTCVCWFGLSQ